ncbi:hypothetical protein ACQEVB_33325 [Pseudonocardia sp. CA-107938]|uniref:hypothetical protein n=1 Tax=Pseudonocardia sp. CA-107938 TaxID=3240021 RepID=UPI003D8B52E4
MTVRTESTRTALRGARMLLAAYAALSAVAVAVLVVMRDDAAVATDAAWVRASIVLVSALLTVLFAAQAAGGSARGFLRLRLVSAIMLVAIVVIVAIPGAFPVWLRIEQTLCGVLLAGVVLLVNRTSVRALFAR